jgi:hypothetical protein
MGKDSLIKSTAKKKSTTKKEEESKKKSAKKASAASKKAVKKTTKKTSAKTARTSAAKSTSKKTERKAAKPKTKKSTAAAKTTAKSTKTAKTKKKPAIAELISKRFEPLPGAPKPTPAPSRKATYSDSPPIIGTSDPKEAARIRALLQAKFSMADIKASAKPPAKKGPKAATETAKPATPELEKSEPVSPSQEPPYKPPSPADETPIITAPVSAEETEPMSRVIKIGIAGAVLLVFILLAVSQNNSSKFYIQPKEGALEIWKGRFSPKDKRFFMVLHGVQLERTPKAVYSRAEVFPMIFDYYLEKADMLLEVGGLPDFEGIKGYLYKAQSYAITPAMKDNVKGRLNSIERMILLYKADVSISKNTKASLAAALKALQKASSLVANPMQQQEIDQKIELVKKRQVELTSAGE